jgi:hypothetical protein
MQGSKGPEGLIQNHSIEGFLEIYDPSVDRVMDVADAIKNLKGLNQVQSD